MSLPDRPKNGSEKLAGKLNWMIDSEASMYMTSDEQLLEKSQTTRLVLIDVPNGTQTVLTRQGSVVLRENLNADKLLFVPNLSYNLISIGKITKDLNCSVTFIDDCCVLQDRTPRISIGTSEQRDGVYYYGKKSLKAQNNAVRTSELLHKQMGHPSSEVMSCFAKELGFSDYLRKKSDVRMFVFVLNK